GIRDFHVTGVQTCALPISGRRRSHAVILEHQAASGAYPASPTFSAYRGYSWYRDGAFIAEGISRWGDVASANGFHTWAAKVLTEIGRASCRERVQACVVRG